MQTNKFLFFSLVFLLLSTSAYPQPSKPQQYSKTPTEWLIAPVGGIEVSIISNSTQGAGRLRSRWIYVFIEPVSFSIQNLTSLFIALGAKFIDPPDLRIFVYTDKAVLTRAAMSQSIIGTVNLREDPAGRQEFEQKYLLQSSGYNRSYYRRSGDWDETFWYTTQSDKAETSVISLRKAATEAYSHNLEKDLALAVRKRDFAKARALVAQGADVNAKDDRGFTSLIYAAQRGDYALAKELVDAGADVSSKAPGGFTPVISAAFSGSLEIVELLLKKGVQIDTDCQEGVSALAIAVSWGYPKIVEVLLAAGADANCRIAGSETPLMKAVQQNRIDIIKALLRSGADVNARTEDGKNVLMLLGCDLMTYRVLVDAGADVNLKDKQGWTPLMYFSDRNEIEKVRLLLERGAEVNAGNHQGETALRISKKYRGNRELIQLLRKAGAQE